MTQPVVDQFELIDIEDRHHEGPVGPAGFLRQLLRQIEELAPIVSVGQRIALGGLDQSCLEHLPLGDIENCPRNAADTPVAALDSRLVEHHMTTHTAAVTDLALIDLRPATLQQFVVCRLIPVRQRLGSHLEDRVADHAVRRPADESGEGDIASDIEAFGILEEDRRGQVIDAGLQVVALDRKMSLLLLCAARPFERPARTGQADANIFRRSGVDDVVGTKRNRALDPAEAQFLGGKDEIGMLAQRQAEFAHGTAQPLFRDRNDVGNRLLRDFDECGRGHPHVSQKRWYRTAIDGKPDNLAVILRVALRHRTLFSTGQLLFRLFSECRKSMFPRGYRQL